MSRPLAGKHALVTGGSRGIGAAIVKRLARDGADVALTFVSRPDEASKIAAAAQALGLRAMYLPCCIATGAVPGSGLPVWWLKQAWSPATKTFGKPLSVKSASTRTRPLPPCEAPTPRYPQ